jgi:hypothetical protein
VTDNTASQLHRLRCEATDRAAAGEIGSPEWLACLLEINRVRVLAEWPVRVAQRGVQFPARYG